MIYAVCENLFPPDEAGHHNEETKTEELIHKAGHKAVYEIYEDIIQQSKNCRSTCTLRGALIKKPPKRTC